MADEAVEAVEHQVIRQVEAGGAGLLTGMDPAVLDSTGAPEGDQRVNYSPGKYLICFMVLFH